MFSDRILNANAHLGFGDILKPVILKFGSKIGSVLPSLKPVRGVNSNIAITLGVIRKVAPIPNDAPCVGNLKVFATVAAGK